MLIFNTPVCCSSPEGEIITDVGKRSCSVLERRQSKQKDGFFSREILARVAGKALVFI